MDEQAYLAQQAQRQEEFKAANIANDEEWVAIIEIGGKPSEPGAVFALRKYVAKVLVEVKLRRE